MNIVPTRRDDLFSADAVRADTPGMTARAKNNCYLASLYPHEHDSTNH